MMKKSKIEDFAELLVQRVRDAAVRSCDQQLEPNAQSPMAKRWKSTGFSPMDIIPDCVDETIFQLLNALDEGLIRLTYSPHDEEPVDLTRDGEGELGGLFMASGGWRTTYATERVNDDFSDLA